MVIIVVVIVMIIVLIGIRVIMIVVISYRCLLGGSRGLSKWVNNGDN